MITKFNLLASTGAPDVMMLAPTPTLHSSKVTQQFLWFLDHKYSTSASSPCDIDDERSGDNFTNSYGFQLQC